MPDDYSNDDTQPQKPKPKPSREALVKELCDWCKTTREFWEPIFNDMRAAIKFAAGNQWPAMDDDSPELEKPYQVNFVQRVINQAVANIYAKNPTVKAERRKRLEYTVWDGERETLEKAKFDIHEAAKLAVAEGMVGDGVETPPPPEAAAIVVDYAQGAQRKKQLDRVGETLETLIEFEMDEQEPEFENQMKDLITREKTCGVGYISIKYQRERETVVTSSATLPDFLSFTKDLQARAAQMEADPTYSDDDAKAEDLRLLVQNFVSRMQGQAGEVLREGLVFDFPPATSILVDPKCRSLIDFVGANRIAEQLYLTPEAIQAQWNVDVREEAAQYKDGQTMESNPATAAEGKTVDNWKDGCEACVWIVYDKARQMRYVVCDGYCDFLEEPASPWPEVSGFWPIIALKLKRVEMERNCPSERLTIFGQSDVQLIQPQQEELNRSQEALRQHRIANKPGYLTGKDTLSTNDQNNMAGRPAHGVIQLDNVPPGTPVKDLITPFPTVPLDPSLYEIETVMSHVFLTVGSQQANLGQQGDDEKATGQAIAEQSRVQGVESEVDALDKFLSRVMRVGGEMCLREMAEEVVKRKVGPGAVWPTQPQTRAELARQIFLKIEGASSGRPNKALELANFEKMAPFMIQLAQLMGLSVEPLLRHLAKILEFKFDLDEWLSSAALPVAAVAGMAGQQPAHTQPAAPQAQAQQAGGPSRSNGGPPVAVAQQARGPATISAP